MQKRKAESYFRGVYSSLIETWKRCDERVCLVTFSVCTNIFTLTVPTHLHRRQTKLIRESKYEFCSDAKGGVRSVGENTS